MSGLSVSRKKHPLFRPSLELLEARALLNAGNLDPTFGVGGVVTNPLIDNGFTGLVEQADGKLLAAGARHLDTVLDRYNSDGTLDSTFGSGGQVIAGLGICTPVLLALQSHGKILVFRNTAICHPAAMPRYRPHLNT